MLVSLLGVVRRFFVVGHDAGVVGVGPARFLVLCC